MIGKESFLHCGMTWPISLLEIEVLKHLVHGLEIHSTHNTTRYRLQCKKGTKISDEYFPTLYLKCQIFFHIQLKTRKNTKKSVSFSHLNVYDIINWVAVSHFPTQIHRSANVDSKLSKICTIRMYFLQTAKHWQWRKLNKAPEYWKIKKFRNNWRNKYAFQ